jgi:hypothetical protein
MAKGLLGTAGFSGKVLAVLSATIYFASKDGEILWMSWEKPPMHRRCVLTSFQPNAICVGQSFCAQGSFLQFGDGTAIDLSQAEEWTPSVVRPKYPEPLTVINACTRRLLEAIPKLGNAKGFGQIIPQIIPMISSFVDGNRQAISNADPLLAKARKSILGLATACFNFDMAEVTRRGRELVGLGPGLTPSGDDFLGGLLFAAYSLKSAYPEDFDWEQKPVLGLIDWARTQTHPISHAILSDLARGHGPEPLHEVVTSLLKGENLDHTMVEVTRLIEIGDTSGWEILAGMLTGMFFVEGKLKLGMEENFDTCRRHQTED